MGSLFYGIGVGSNGVAYAVGNAGQVYTSSYSSSYVTWTAKSLSVSSPPRLNAVATYDGVVVYVAGVS
eukprot:scaffold16742_cov388-Ochromonas_danica.AAC.1